MYFAGRLDPISNRTGWLLDVALEDADAGGPVDIAGASVVVEVRDPQTGAVALTATTGNGRIAIVDTGVFRLDVPPGETQRLCAATYQVGAIITLNGESRQLIIGTLPVLDGIVSEP
jgi:hypothetical protein